MKTGLIGLLVAGLLAAPLPEARVVYYTFTATDGHFGSFSYEQREYYPGGKAPRLS